MTDVRENEDGFFVGYFDSVPRSVAVFAMAVGGGFIGVSVAIACLIGVSADNPVAAKFLPGTSATGVYRALPYPMLLMAADREHPAGHTVLLGGDGKRGAQSVGERYAGQTVTLAGFALKRGSIDMLVVDTIAAAPDSGAGAVPVSLGRWRIGGEICDGKCASGAMKPGTGLAHKACAGLCLTGGLPPILVSSEPIEGSQFLLLADETGGPLAPTVWKDAIARAVSLEGEVERIGDLLVFKVDWRRAQVL